MDSPSNSPLPPRTRGRALPFVLSSVMLVIYFGFILLVAYDKPLLGQTVVPGLSWGILLGALVIVSAWLLTCVYVFVANRDGGME